MNGFRFQADCLRKHLRARALAYALTRLAAGSRVRAGSRIGVGKDNDEENDKGGDDSTSRDAELAAIREELAALRKLFEEHYQSTAPGYTSYDVHPDGQRFIMIKPVAQASSQQINLVQNWFEELERIVPSR